MKFSKKKSKQNKILLEEVDGNQQPFVILDDSVATSRPRIISLYNDIKDETAEDVVLSLMLMKELDKEAIYEDENNPESEIIGYYHKPIDLLISSWGGEALNMFAIYDTMRMVRDECEIHTLGMGKVMSAGVLLLAAGTKGKRRIGANCRIMLHSVVGGQHGSLHNLENEIAETRWIQQQHIEALIAETSMTSRQLKRLLNKKVNIYLNAKEAVKYGIADEII
jgi:ATP-dependent Clp protease protease subunit